MGSRQRAAGVERLFFLAFAVASLAGGSALAGKPSPARSVPVDATLVRDLGGGCEYRARVQGEVFVEPTFRWGEPHRYLPDVTVTARLACGGEVRGTARERVATPFESRQAFLDALSHVGTVATGEGEAMCFYRPEFEFDDLAMRPQDLHRWCQPTAFGGGPSRPPAAR